MPDLSRHQFCTKWIDEDKRLFLDTRKPYRFRAFADNSVYTVVQGDTLFTIAGRHFAPIDRAAGLWWVIADFQPNPITDPTLVLEPGTVLILPSLAVLYQEIFNVARSLESRI